jgi:hypothetical protein
MLDTSQSSQMEENVFEKVMEEEIMEQPQAAKNNGQANNGGSTYKGYTSKGNYTPSPMLKDAKLALDDLTRILKPPRKTGAGYDDPGLDSVLQKRLEGMEQFLWMYINPKSVAYNQWMTASLKTVKNLCKKPFHSYILRCVRGSEDLEDVAVVWWVFGSFPRQIMSLRCHIHRLVSCLCRVLA